MFTDTNLEFTVFVTFSAILRLSRDYPVVSGGGNRSTLQKPLPNLKSLATFSLLLNPSLL